MAKRSRSEGPNLSEAIRRQAAENPGQGPTEIAEELKKQGIEVKPEYVSTVLSLARRRGKKEGRPAVRGRAPQRRRAPDQLSLEDLLQAKKLAEQMGGIEAARRALDALASLNV